MDVFDEFQETAYTFLKLAQGGVKGNSFTEESSATGIFKERNGMIQTNSLETVQSDATLHIHPDETFVTELGGNLIGQGIKATKNGYEQTYRIIGVVEGFNFDNNVLEFYRLTLKAEKLVVNPETT